VSPTTATVGALTCRIVNGDESDEPPEIVAVLCHGVGSRGDGLAPIAHHVFRRFPDLVGKVRFVFPQGPLVHQLVGFFPTWAWWHSAEENVVGAAGPPAGLLQSRRLLSEAIEELLGRWSVDPSRLVLGGFSQGAAIATDIALHLPTSPMLLTIFAGHVVAGAGWQERASARPGLRVLQTHGTKDTGTTFAKGAALRSLLEQAAMQVEFLEFDGPHMIPTHGVERFAQLLLPDDAVLPSPEDQPVENRVTRGTFVHGPGLRGPRRS
jgi:phospholipase/carboxylesterase